jgi:hypothetical protein
MTKVRLCIENASTACGRWVQSRPPRTLNTKILTFYVCLDCHLSKLLYFGALTLGGYAVLLPIAIELVDNYRHRNNWNAY